MQRQSSIYCMSAVTLIFQSSYIELIYRIQHRRQNVALSLTTRMPLIVLSVNYTALRLHLQGNS